MRIVGSGSAPASPSCSWQTPFPIAVQGSPVRNLISSEIAHDLDDLVVGVELDHGAVVAIVAVGDDDESRALGQVDLADFWGSSW
jgi:hypothetical protein